MTAVEQQLSLAQAQAGMVLTRDLLDTKGHILMARNTALSPTSIAALHRRDITHVWVFTDGLPSPESPLQDLAVLHHQKVRLERLFRHVGESEDGLYLMHLMARYWGVKLP